VNIGSYLTSHVINLIKGTASKGITVFYKPGIGFGILIFEQELVDKYHGKYKTLIRALSDIRPDSCLSYSQPRRCK